jgi:TetR/AcrR family fatty acid metabolism transcriptional regulator
MNIHSVTSAPPLRAAARADRRDALLRAAIDVFASRGFFNAQVADVARAAGVAAGTVYLYFDSKDDLLVSIFERTMRDAIADGRAAVAPVRDPVEQLRTVARVHLDRMGRDRSLAVVFQVELRQSTKFMERLSSTLLREYLGIIRGIIVEGQKTGVFRRELNATLAAKLFFGGLDEMATNWILSRRKYTLASEADAIVDLFVHGAGAARVRRRK